MLKAVTRGARVLLKSALFLCVCLPSYAAGPGQQPVPEARAIGADQKSTADAERAHELITEARELAATGDTAGAEQSYREALALGPSPALYEELIALLAPDPAREADIALLWTGYLAAFPDHPAALLANGDRLYSAGSYSAAAETYARGAAAAPRDARFLVGQANCRFSLGDYELATRLYSQALEASFDPVTLANLASALEALGRDSEAQAAWQRALADHPDDAALAMQYGLTLSESGEYAAALAQYKRGQLLEPENDLFFNRAGFCLVQLERTEEAVAEVERALALRPEPVYYLNLAIGYQRLDNAEQAGLYYREGLARYPENADLLESYADFLTSQGDLMRALEQLRVLVDQTASVQVCVRLAELAYQTGDLTQADAAYREALALSPPDVAANAAYAVFLAALARDAELLAHLSSAHDRLNVAGYAGVVTGLADFWLDEEQYASAARLLEEIIAIDSRVPAAYNALAMCQQLQGDSRAALTALKRGLNDAGDNYAGRYLEAYITQLAYGAETALPLAAALLDHPQADAGAYELYINLAQQQQDRQALLEVARRGLAKHPDSGELLRVVANELYGAGDLGGVIRLLADRRYRNTACPERDELLGRAYFEQGNYVKSAAHLTAAATASPDDADLWVELGQARYFARQLDDARAALTRSLALEPHKPSTQLWLGLVLLEQGELQGAALSLGEAASSAEPWADGAAWIALAQARLALRRDDAQSAQAFLQQAAAQSARSPCFEMLLAETRAEAGY